MTKYQKENIAEGIGCVGIGLMCLGYFVMCAEFIFGNFIGIGFAMMGGGLLMAMGSIVYQAFKGWL